MMGGTSFFSFPERMKCIGDHPFVAACSSDLRIRRGPQALLSFASLCHCQSTKWGLLNGRLSSLSVVQSGFAPFQ